MLTRTFFVLTIHVTSLLCHTAPADDPTTQERIEGPNGTWAVMRTMDVKVVDESGSAVVGAACRPYAMRFVETGGYAGWSEELLGLRARRFYTDENGIATIRFPKAMNGYGKDVTTSDISFFVEHPMFVLQIVDRDLGVERAPAETEVILSEGAEFVASGVDSNGRPITGVQVMIGGEDSSPLCQTDDSDPATIRCRSIADGTWQTMLIKVADDGRHLFSDCFDLKYRKGKTVNLRKMPLLPGASLSGRLSDDVPRPIQDGYVIATAAPIPAEYHNSPENPSLVWEDWTEVAADGSFEFASLPRSGQVQLIAVSDGWVSTSIYDADHPNFVTGQLFDLDGTAAEIRLAMESTGSIEFAIVDSDGQPLSDEILMASPNQHLFKEANTILGTRTRTADQLRQRYATDEELEANGHWYNFHTPDFPFEQKLVDGKCVLTGLPLGRRFGFALYQSKWKLVSDAPAQPTLNRIRVDSAELKKVKLTAVPK